MTTAPIAPTTNALNVALAADLAAARNGTFTGLIIRKEGTEKGGVVYGNDLVHAVIITGFSYMNLVARSKAKLEAMTDADIDALVAKGMTGFVGRGAKATTVAVTRADFDDARAELLASYERTLTGTNTSTTEDVYEPLVVEGETVRGCRVYTGNKSGNPDAAPVGTIYLQGLQIGSRVLEAGINGPAPRPQSAAKTVAKNALSSRLPSSRYVSYKLSPNGEWVLNVGGQAAAAADGAGVTLDENRVAEVKLALAC